MGEFFALLSALCFATANVTITKGSVAGDADNGAFLSILLTAGVAMIAMLVSGGVPAAASLNLPGLAWFALGGVLTAFVGRIFLFASVQALGAMRASTVKRLNPFFAVILGVLILEESLGGWMIPGMILIFVSFLCLARDSWSRTGAISPTPQAAVPSISTRLFDLGLVYGPISAFSYALGYLARKQGAEHHPGTVSGHGSGRRCRHRHLRAGVTRDCVIPQGNRQRLYAH